MALGFLQVIRNKTQSGIIRWEGANTDDAYRAKAESGTSHLEFAIDKLGADVTLTIYSGGANGRSKPRILSSAALGGPDKAALLALHAQVVASAAKPSAPDDSAVDVLLTTLP